VRTAGLTVWRRIRQLPVPISKTIRLTYNRHKDTVLEFVSNPDPVNPKEDPDPGILLSPDPDLDKYTAENKFRIKNLNRKKERKKDVKRHIGTLFN
jgi:hypothetical protein